MSGVSGGLLCVNLTASGRLCPCESEPGIPSAMPFMNRQGLAACECHSKQAARYGVTPFPCSGTFLCDGCGEDRTELSDCPHTNRCTECEGGCALGCDQDRADDKEAGAL